MSIRWAKEISVRLGKYFCKAVRRGNRKRVALTAGDYVVKDISVNSLVVFMLMSPKAFVWAVLFVLLSPFEVEIGKLQS